MTNAIILSSAQINSDNSMAVLGLAKREFSRIKQDAPYLTALTIFLALMMLPTLSAMALDDRLHNGINIWIKPFKFEVALVMYVVTLAVFARWIPIVTRQKTWFKIFNSAVVTSIVLEIVWINGSAAAGISSHFNVASPLMAAAYSIAGLAAVILTSGALVYGFLIWRNKNTALSKPMHFAIWFGSISMAVTTTIAASYMAAQSGHLVGGNLLDVEAMPIMGWATDGGDLRVAHFFASHIIHILPLFVLFTSWMFKSQNLNTPLNATLNATIGVAALYFAFTFYTLWEAVNGLPFLGAIFG